ncbi:MAG: precorrin-6y C5,15-methyltransferase (decarboxylating) subunit CbiE [Prevotella sp.]|nr:precorrin-6y C5,15-methyltransferase (decarboxylating) subunit CbiE [Prevotella sp.]
MKFIVIGITDNPQPWFPPEVLDIIRQGRVFSGGKRHHDIVAPLLPADSQWIDITVPLDSVFEQYAHLPLSSEGEGGRPIIVFASGDPLFFGFANTLRRQFPDADIRVYPTFNSLQMLAHRLLLPYHDMRIVSLTGRPWPEFDRALIERTEKIGVLTDKEHTPAAIAQRMLEYGYTNYTMHVGEHLGHPTKEQVTTLTLEEAAQRSFSMPNCLILRSVCCDTIATKPFGLPDTSFALLDGREKMITKMPIRLLTLQALDLPRRHVLWDIGFCTGSVSIEARLLFPHLEVHAFEIRPECEAIILENARRHGAPGIHIHMGDFCSVCRDIIATTPPPDAVFIGGHGGQLKHIMAQVTESLPEGGIIVMNSVKAPKVTTDSHQLWDEACRELGLQQEPPMRVVIDEHHPIEILKAHK